jgi:hypothetical protein
MGLTIPVHGYLTSDKPKKKKEEEEEKRKMIFRRKGVVTLNEMQLSREVTIN